MRKQIKKEVKNFMTKFQKNLKQAFCDSQYELCSKNRENDENYQSIDKEYNRVFEEIRDKLGNKNRKLMLELELLQNQIACIDDECIYLQGMIDCAVLLKTIELI